MLMNELSIIVRQMRVFAEREFKDIELGFPEQIVLMALSSVKCSNQETIASILEIDKGAITKTLVKLETKGFIKREENPGNKREKLIIKTLKADEFMNQMRNSLQIWNDKMSQGLTAEEIAIGEKVIKQMAINSKKLNKED
ncbi:MAG: MarR family transcriptional regulator [Anaerovoracaceae bacterium]